MNKYTRESQLAQDRRRRDKACTYKTRYADLGQAQAAGARYRQNVYRCPYCPGFHTTSPVTKRGLYDGV